jgi:hypothetical protein
VALAGLVAIASTPTGSDATLAYRALPCLLHGLAYWYPRQGAESLARMLMSSVRHDDAYVMEFIACGGLKFLCTARKAGRTPCSHNGCCGFAQQIRLKANRGHS